MTGRVGVSFALTLALKQEIASLLLTSFLAMTRGVGVSLASASSFALFINLSLRCFQANINEVFATASKHTNQNKKSFSFQHKYTL